MPRKRLPDFADRFTCIGRLQPRLDLDEEADRFCFRCERCKRIAWSFSTDDFVRCPGCAMRVALHLLKVPAGYGYVLKAFEGYTPGGARAAVPQAEDPRA